MKIQHKKLKIDVVLIKAVKNFFISIALVLAMKPQNKLSGFLFNKVLDVVGKKT